MHKNTIYRGESRSIDFIEFHCNTSFHNHVHGTKLSQGTFYLDVQYLIRTCTVCDRLYIPILWVSCQMVNHMLFFIFEKNLLHFLFKLFGMFLDWGMTHTSHGGASLAPSHRRRGCGVHWRWWYNESWACPTSPEQSHHMRVCGISAPTYAHVIRKIGYMPNFLYANICTSTVYYLPNVETI